MFLDRQNPQNLPPEHTFSVVDTGNRSGNKPEVTKILRKIMKGDPRRNGLQGPRNSQSRLKEISLS